MTFKRLNFDLQNQQSHIKIDVKFKRTNQLNQSKERKIQVSTNQLNLNQFKL